MGWYIGDITCINLIRFGRWKIPVEQVLCNRKVVLRVGCMLDSLFLMHRTPSLNLSEKCFRYQKYRIWYICVKYAIIPAWNGKCHTLVSKWESRCLGDGLFEFRVKAQEGIGRVFFCTVVNREVIILHTFIKKTQQTPKKEITIAKKRMREVNDHVN